MSYNSDHHFILANQIVELRTSVCTAGEMIGSAGPIDTGVIV